MLTIGCDFHPPPHFWAKRKQRRPNVVGINAAAAAQRVAAGTIYRAPTLLRLLLGFEDATDDALSAVVVAVGKESELRIHEVNHHVNG